MDKRQRVCLRKALTQEECEQFKAYHIYRSGSKIVLEPVREQPATDHWIFKNPKAHVSLLKGIQDVEEDKVKDLGSFHKYANESLKKNFR